MKATDLFQIFILYNPDVRGVTGFKEIKGQKNAIELIFDNGRTGKYEIIKNEAKLTIEDNLYSLKNRKEST